MLTLQSINASYTPPTETDTKAAPSRKQCEAHKRTAAEFVSFFHYSALSQPFVKREKEY